jgi:tRNA A37 threonylcarbamoyladenosine biosynthesis protein TsaE
MNSGVRSQAAAPHVFGLHGEWGSGKTSFLRQLRFELDHIKDGRMVTV